MDWTQITIEISTTDAERAGNIAHMAVPYGFYMEDYSDLEQGAMEIAHSTLIDEALLKMDRSIAKLHLYIGEEENPAEALEYLTQRYKAEKIAFKVLSERVSDEDWANGWKAYFKPAPIGNRLLICPSWETCENPQNRKVLTIDPGAAFGTGTHSTTKLCLEVLENTVNQGDKVLDIGTGSGILSIAALLFGASQALGVDIDPQSVKTAKENGAVNNFHEPEFTVIKGSLTDEVSGKFDVVAANIVADAIIALSGQVAQFMHKDSVFLASGILDIYKDEVMTALKTNGFDVQEIFEDGGWVCIKSKCRV